jgi:hypothetical protein
LAGFAVVEAETEEAAVPTQWVGPVVLPAAQ